MSDDGAIPTSSLVLAVVLAIVATVLITGVVFAFVFFLKYKRQRDKIAAYKETSRTREGRHDNPAAPTRSPSPRMGGEETTPPEAVGSQLPPQVMLEDNSALLKQALEQKKESSHTPVDPLRQRPELSPRHHSSKKSKSRVNTRSVAVDATLDRHETSRKSQKLQRLKELEVRLESMRQMQMMMFQQKQLSGSLSGFSPFGQPGAEQATMLEGLFQQVAELQARMQDAEAQQSGDSPLAPAPGFARQQATELRLRISDIIGQLESEAYGNSLILNTLLARMSGKEAAMPPPPPVEMVEIREPPQELDHGPSANMDNPPEPEKDDEDSVQEIVDDSGLDHQPDALLGMDDLSEEDLEAVIRAQLGAGQELDDLLADLKISAVGPS
eukprot:NODE_327_length_1630_cov_151.345984_g246_i0.p1 GENE.NODE_327_length_1630_cov_151.345984_g246_i0~~NODE_327_length_1630_cov_151.345984_g246_i0.p1  ORF type:complete len:384 (-),score=60.39 NODE_327_length_1630_cov_151.345984_g246_i0:431-1582(-)